uniref:Uncharacterized protein n=1 Tax=Arundo donax TaxID=35708 RepID=A0A0A8YLX5_ARUDO
MHFQDKCMICQATIFCMIRKLLSSKIIQLLSPK